MYPESRVHNVLKEIWQRSMLTAENLRKDAAARKLDYFNNEQREHLLAQIASLYKWPDKLIPVNVNVVRQIVRALSMVYLRDAVRTVEGSTQDQEVYAFIEDTAALPTKMKKCSRLAKLLGNTLLRPLWRNGKPDLDILTGDVLTVFTGDSPEDIQGVLVTLYDDSGDTGRVLYSLWTDEEYRLIDHRGNTISTEENPYRTIPFVSVWNSPPTGSFWQNGADDLMMAQDAINQRLSDIFYVARFQGFGLGYVKGKGTSTEDLDNLIVGPGSMMTLPEDGEVGFASPQAPIMDSLEAIDRLMKWAAVSNGLSASSVSTAVTQESGVAKVAGNAALEEMRRDDIANFARVEDQLFKMWRVIWNYHNPGRPMSDSAVVQVSFYDPKPTIDPYDQWRIWQEKMQAGLISPIDILIAENPDLTREAAKKKFDRIREELMEFKPPEVGGGPTGSLSQRLTDILNNPPDPA